MTLLAILLAASLGSLKPDTLALDTSASVVRWTGTKFFGLGKHEGIVRLSDEYVAFVDGRVVGARFVVDMRSIEVTVLRSSVLGPRRPFRGSRLTNDLVDDEIQFTLELVLRPKRRSA